MTADDDEFGAPEPVDERTVLQRIRPLYDRRKAVEEELAGHQAHCEKLEAVIKAIDEQQLPELLDALGVTGVSIDGKTVTVEDHVHASLPVKDPEKRKRGIAWLKANKCGSIVKRGFGAKFGSSKKEQEAAEAFAAYLAKYPGKVQIEDKDDVHHGALTSLVKELMKEGRATQEVREILGAHVVRRAKIT